MWLDHLDLVRSMQDRLDIQSGEKYKVEVNGVEYKDFEKTTFEGQSHVTVVLKKNQTFS